MATKITDLSTPEYWSAIYTGVSTAQKGGHESDRFAEVMRHLDGMDILEVAAGYAALSKRIRAERPDVHVTALDFCEDAKKRSGFEPYILADAHELPFPAKSFDTVVCCQGMDYMAVPATFLREAARVGASLILTVTDGESSGKSSPVKSVFTEYMIREMLERHGEVRQLYRVKGMIFAKARWT